MPELSTYLTLVILIRSCGTRRSFSCMRTALRISGELKSVMSPTRSRMVTPPSCRVVILSAEPGVKDGSPCCLLLPEIDEGCNRIVGGTGGEGLLHPPNVFS